MSEQKEPETREGWAANIGCFLVIVGFAIAYAIVRWADLGFPRFW